MIRFGIVGAGSIARKFAIDIKEANNAVLVAVASRTLEKAREFQQEFDIEHAFGSYKELAESNLIDAVYIATPHSFHREQSILFLNNKKHVLCEKPLAVNVEEVTEMIDVATTNNVVLMEAMWAIFLPANRYALDIIHSGELGKITEMNFSFGFDIGDLEANKEKRLLNINLAGGSLLDVGVYNIAISQFFKPDPIKQTSTNARLFSTGVDLATDSKILYEDDTILTVHSALDKDLTDDAVITLEKGDIIIPNFWRATSVIVNGKTLEFPFRSEGFEYEIESFVNSVLDKEKENHVMTHVMSKRIISILDRIRNDIDLVYPFEKEKD